MTADSSRRVVRGGLTYAVAAVLQRAAPIFLLPLFARVLSPAEFGQIGVIATLAAALSTLLTFGLETAIFREAVQLRSDGRALRTMVNSVGGFALVVPVGTAAGIGFLTAPLVSRLLNVPSDAFILGCIAAAINVAATLVPLTLLRAQERLRDYLQLTSIQVAVTAALTILLVAVLDAGVVGWMLASVASSAVLMARGLSILGHPWALEIDGSYLSKSLAFGVPLVPHALAHWGLAVSDRAILMALVSPAQVGAYYVAYQLSLPVTLVSIALSQASQPLFVEVGNSAVRQRDLNAVVTSHALVVMVAAAVVALLGPLATLLMLPPAYALAAEYLPWLAFGACLFGLYLMPMNAITVTAGRTRYVWLITALAAIANITLNLALIPRLGTYAAAVNTAVSYAILLVGVLVFMERVTDAPIRYERGRLAYGAALIAGACAVAAWLTPADLLTGFLVRSALLSLLGVALVTLGPLNREARSALRAIRPAHGGAAQ